MPPSHCSSKMTFFDADQLIDCCHYNRIDTIEENVQASRSCDTFDASFSVQKIMKTDIGHAWSHIKLACYTIEHNRCGKYQDSNHDFENANLGVRQWKTSKQSSVQLKQMRSNLKAVLETAKVFASCRPPPDSVSPFPGSAGLPLCLLSRVHISASLPQLQHLQAFIPSLVISSHRWSRWRPKHPHQR